jgi:riboflavin transporter FmnP
MKTFALFLLFCFIGVNAHSIGRPTNVFATYKVVHQKAAAKQQFKPIVRPELTIEKGARMSQRVFSVANYLMYLAAKK